jgi:hypothetical protein
MNTTFITNPNMKRRRRRPAIVCTECRRRKIACDRKTPCAQCILWNATCTYSNGDDSSRGSAQSIPTRAAHTQLASTEIRDLASSSRIPQTYSIEGSPGISAASSSTVAVSEAESISRVTDYTRLLEKADPSFNAVTTVQLSEQEAAGPSKELSGLCLKQPISRPPLKGHFEKSKLYGQSHWAHTFDEVRLL